MKIALVCPYDWSRHGGVRSHVASLATFLAADHEVRIFAPSTGAEGTGPADRLLSPLGGAVGVRYNQSVAPVALSPAALRRTTDALRSFAPHIVHVHEPFVPMASLAAAAFGPRPVVGTFHAWSSGGRLYRALSPATRRVATRMAVRVAVSPAAQEFAAGALGLPLRAFDVVPNGVDVEAFRTAEPIPELVDPERPLILFVGRLEPRKGLEVLIRAFLRLRARMPRVRLCVVGEGPERERCQRMVPSSIRPDVLFVGAVSEAQKPRYHASADVYVAPNTGGESFGIVLIEAMAAGLPVLASDIPGFRSVMHEGREGRFFPVNDAFALADALGTLLENERLRRALADEGQRTVAQYAWPVIGGRLLALYRRARGA